MGNLTVLFAKNAMPGRHGDGDGLHLVVKPSGAKSWVLRVQVMGRRRDIGLGGFSTMSLVEAREEAARLRKLAKRGLDPVAERDRDMRPTPDFAQAARDAHKEFAKGWTEKHGAAFMTSLETHVFPALGKMRVDHVDAVHVRDALSEIWADKPAMARKVRVRVGQVLDFAKAKGWRKEGAPPAKLIRQGLARHERSKGFASMPYNDVPHFVADLQGEAETIGRQALLFTILTAARSGEVRSARWCHIDLDAKLWTRPADLMKEREEHTVTLNDAAVAILRHVQPLASKSDALIFPGKSGKALSDMTLSKILRDKDLPYVPHGFRASFRNWAGEQMPSIPWAVCEVALAHAVGTETTRAYLRTDFLDMRRKLAEAWGSFCMGAAGNVLKLAVA